MKGHWIDWTLPWEEPPYWQPIKRLRWRQMQERIYFLEQEALGIHSNLHLGMPWWKEFAY